MKQKFYGKMVLPEHNLKRLIYGVFDTRSAKNIKFDSISDILENIYYKSPKSQIHIEIKVNGVTRFDEQGELYIDRDEFLVYDWCVNGQNLGLILHQLTEQQVEIMIDDMMEGKVIDEES